MAAAFVELRAELFDDDHVPIPDPAEAFSLSKVLFRARTASGDCCTPRLPWGPIDVRPFIDRAESTRVDGVLVRYLRLEDLAAMRRAAGRAKDLRRLAEMEGFGRLGQPN